MARPCTGMKPSYHFRFNKLKQIWIQAIRSFAWMFRRTWMRGFIGWQGSLASEVALFLEFKGRNKLEVFWKV